MYSVYIKFLIQLSINQSHNLLFLRNKLFDALSDILLNKQIQKFHESFLNY